MTITEFIAVLEDVRRACGDVPIYVADDREFLTAPELEGETANVAASTLVGLGIHPTMVVSTHAAVVIR